MDETEARFRVIIAPTYGYDYENDPRQCYEYEGVSCCMPRIRWPKVHDFDTLRDAIQYANAEVKRFWKEDHEPVNAEVSVMIYTATHDDIIKKNVLNDKEVENVSG